MTAAGVPLRVVKGVLRHTNIRDDADRYAHPVPQVFSEALQAIDRTLLSADTLVIGRSQLVKIECIWRPKEEFDGGEGT